MGVVIDTTSMSGIVTSKRQSPVPRAKPSSRALLSASVLRALRQHREMRPLHVAENRRDGVPRKRVAFAHVAGADEADAERVRHGIYTIPPSSLDNDCSSLPPAIRFCNSSMLMPDLSKVPSVLPRLSTVKRSPTA